VGLCLREGSQEERIGFDNQLTAIERTLKAKEKDVEELVLMSHDATHAKEVAKAELLKLEAIIAEERKHREKEVQERKQQMQQKLELSKRMQGRIDMRRSQHLAVDGELDEEQENKLIKQQVLGRAKEEMTEGQLEEDLVRINSFEEAFRKIKEATGVADVNEVITKFLTQDETHNNLVAMTKEAQAHIDALNEDKSQLKAKVQEIKYSGTGSLGSRRIVDEFESHLSEANAKCERNKQKFERIAKILINVKAGVEHLADMLEVVKIDVPSILMTDDTVVEVLSYCEQKMMKLLSAVPQESALDGSHDSGPQTQDITPPQNNVRVPLQKKQLGDDDEDGDEEEEDQDQVMDRDEVKKISTLMLEKVNKKTKRKVKGEKVVRQRPASK
jgi:hypothetical protein